METEFVHRNTVLSQKVYASCLRPVIEAAYVTDHNRECINANDTITRCEGWTAIQGIASCIFEQATQKAMTGHAPRSRLEIDDYARQNERYFWIGPKSSSG
jgi:hypothetical protein